MAVVPGGLNQQPAGVAVACLGDRALGSCLSRGMLGRDQPEVGANALAREAVPVADFHGQAEAGQRGDPAQALEVPDDGGVLAVVGKFLDRRVETVPAPEANSKACTTSGLKLLFEALDAR